MNLPIYLDEYYLYIMYLIIEFPLKNLTLVCCYKSMIDINLIIT